MRQLTQRVLQRLNYEGLLETSHIEPQRLRITLKDIMEAGKDEPRIFEVLPALILHRPGAIWRLRKDLPLFPELQNVEKVLQAGKGTFHGVEIRDCIKTEEFFSRYLRFKKKGQKSVTMNLRLAPDEARMLRQMSHGLRIDNASETIRTLLRQKATELNLQKGDWAGQ